jgi:hypothetical protein
MVTQIGSMRLKQVHTNELGIGYHLRLRRGDDAVAIIKSTDVVIAKESFPTEKSRRRRRRQD